jgi:hypothetical protein
MQDAANQGNLALAENPLDGLGSIVSELTCLIEYVQGSIAAIEAEIARELLCSRTENAANMIVLDDVTLPYTNASTTLNACRASLCTAPNVLTEKGPGRQRR